MFKNAANAEAAVKWPRVTQRLGGPQQLKHWRKQNGFGQGGSDARLEGCRHPGDHRFTGSVAGRPLEPARTSLWRWPSSSKSSPNAGAANDPKNEVSDRFALQAFLRAAEAANRQEEGKENFFSRSILLHCRRGPVGCQGRPRNK
jgi:hypothetical protein